MKKPCVWALVMVMVTSAGQSMWANSVGDIKGLGKDRENLTPELIAMRSELLETNLNFYLLRFPAAVQAASRIFARILRSSTPSAPARMACRTVWSKA